VGLTVSTDPPVGLTVSTDPPVGLTIAGSDSGAGAGIQADIKTMGAFGVLATTAITAVTAQNTAEVRQVLYVPPDMVDAQIGAVIEDLAVAAVKTGMLGTAGVVVTVADRAAAGDLPNLVVDPVMVASTGRVFLDRPGIDAYRHLLLPRALIVTPNLWEAAILAGLDPAEGGMPGDVTAMAELARRIHDLGPTWVLVKGGHLPGVDDAGHGGPPDTVPDVLFDGAEITVLSAPTVPTANNHGTGCSLSASIAAGLARGATVPQAVDAAKAFVHRALVGGSHWQLGAGHGPLDHLGWSGAPGGGSSATGP
jgi:hydroxymethylpyrimidine/phosphomethylpyrimidine kinase